MMKNKRLSVLSILVAVVLLNQCEASKRVTFDVYNTVTPGSGPNASVNYFVRLEPTSISPNWYRGVATRREDEDCRKNGDKLVEVTGNVTEGDSVEVTFQAIGLGEVLDFAVRFSVSCDGSIYCANYCKEKGSSRACGRCVDLAEMETQVQQFISSYEQFSEKDNIDKILLEDFDPSIFIERLRSSGYSEEVNACETDWNANSACYVYYMTAIYDTIVLSLSELGPFWTTQGRTLEIDSRWANAPSRIVELMKRLLPELLYNVLKKEEIYTRLHRLNPYDFPWGENPLDSVVTEWITMVRNGNDAAIKDIFGMQLELHDEEFCSGETERSPLCSFLATQEFFNLKQSYLQKSSNSNTLTIFDPIESNQGSFSSFNDRVETFVHSSNILDRIDQQSNRFAEYFSTLATFDRNIALADRGYISYAIQQNSEKLGSRVNEMKSLITLLKAKQSSCASLDMLEGVLSVAFSIAGGVIGGGGVALSFKQIESTFSEVQSIAKKFHKGLSVTQASLNSLESLKGDIGSFVASGQQQASLRRRNDDLKSGVEGVIAKLNANRNAIEDMDDVVEAVQMGRPLDSIKEIARNFVRGYSAYTPAVTKTDLVELSTKYESLLDAFEGSFENGGFLCKLTEADGAATARKAKGIWASISSLLEDIYDQQFEYIDSLVQIVRRKLDSALAQEIAPLVDYRFDEAVWYMVNLRMTAVHLCNLHRYLKKDEAYPACDRIGNKMFLGREERNDIVLLDNAIQRLIQSEQTTPIQVYLPVTNEQGSLHSINWNDLIAGKAVEFQLPATNETYLAQNGWKQVPNALGLIHSMEIFFPIVNSSESKLLSFEITPAELNVVVNSHANAKQYQIKTDSSPTATASYNQNYRSNQCHSEWKTSPYCGQHSDSLKICIPEHNGQFGHRIHRSLPVSIYSKFQIRLTHGQPRENDFIRIPPVVNTLKLRARIEALIVGPARELQEDQKALSACCANKSHFLDVTDFRNAVCKPCPGFMNTAVAMGSHCVSVVEMINWAIQKIPKPE